MWKGPESWVVVSQASPLTRSTGASIWGEVYGALSAGRHQEDQVGCLLKGAWGNSGGAELFSLSPPFLRGLECYHHAPAKYKFVKPMLLFCSTGAIAKEPLSRFSKKGGQGSTHIAQAVLHGCIRDLHCIVNW